GRIARVRRRATGARDVRLGGRSLVRARPPHRASTGQVTSVAARPSATDVSRQSVACVNTKGVREPPAELPNARRTVNRGGAADGRLARHGRAEAVYPQGALDHGRPRCHHRGRALHARDDYYTPI